MRTGATFIPLLSVALGAMAIASHAHADDGHRWSGEIAAGPSIIPDHDGADSYRIMPFAVATLRNGPYSLELQGLRARFDLAPFQGVAAGPVLNVRLPRDEDAGGRVALLDPIDTALELGGFVGLRFGGDARGQNQVRIDITALADVSDVHDGFLVATNLSYAAVRNQRLMLLFDAQGSFGSGRYMRRYFGVTPVEGARTGLFAYRPGASLRDVGAGATMGYRLNDRWGLLGRLSYAYLLGDAADSPIVRVEGSRHQAMGALALSYRF